MTKIYNRLEEVFGELCGRESLPRSRDLQEKIEAVHWAMKLCSLITHDSYFLDQLNDYRNEAEKEDERDNMAEEEMKQLYEEK